MYQALERKDTHRLLDMNLVSGVIIKEGTKTVWKHRAHQNQGREARDLQTPGPRFILAESSCLPAVVPEELILQCRLWCQSPGLHSVDTGCFPRVCILTGDSEVSGLLTSEKTLGSLVLFVLLCGLSTVASLCSVFQINLLCRGSLRSLWD